MKQGTAEASLRADQRLAPIEAGRHPTKISAVRNGAPPPDQRDSLLNRVLRAVDLGPRPFFWGALVSLAVTSVLIMVIASAVRPAGRHPDLQRVMYDFALVAFCVSVAIGLASLLLPARLRGASWPDRVIAAEDRAVLWLAISAWVPFLLIPAYLAARSTFPQTTVWLYFGFDDKRWISATYLLSALAPMIWLALAARVLSVGRGHPPTWRAWLRGLFTGGSASAAPSSAATRPDRPEATSALTGRRERVLVVAAGLATAVVLAWYFLGPPWFLTQNQSLVTAQQDIWLTGFQAMSRGVLPYTGPATMPYGPGTQLVSYLLMQHVTSFSIVGFRQAWAVYQWVGATIIFAVFFLAFGYVRGLFITLFSTLVYPAWLLDGFQVGGSFYGYVGWANPLRYAGIIAMVALVPAVIRRHPSKLAALAGIALGMLWGITSYLAQENLIGGAVGAVVIAALLVLSGTCSWRAARTALIAVAAGSLLVWLPVLAYYAVHGALGHFVRTYFLIPRAMAQGFGNLPWQGGSSMPFSLTTMFHVLPFALAVVAVLTVIQVRPMRVATGWSRDRVRLAVITLITILIFQGALLRSDITDLTATRLIVPAFVVVTATVLPRLLGLQRRVPLILSGAALVAASLLLVPRPALSWTSVRSVAEAPYLDRQRMAASARPAPPRTLAAQRVGAGLDVAPQCCLGPPVSMASVVNLMNHIHKLVGSRTAYVVNMESDEHSYPGFVYFTADLTPAPVVSDKYMTILNEPQLRAYMQYFRTNVLPDTQALVSGSLDAPEARYFLQRYPSAQRILLHLGHEPYWVLLARP